VIRLIVCADDVGLDPGITQGAIEAWQHGIVTDLSVMVARDDWGRTTALLEEAGVTEVGVHLTLCEGRPVLEAHAVPSLIGEEGRFVQTGGRFVRRYLTGRVRVQEVRREWLAQVRKAQAAGLRVTHLDGHKHLHLMPGLFGVARDVLQSCGVRGMRLSREPGAGDRGAVRGLLALLSVNPGRRLDRRAVATTDRVAGIEQAGALTEDALLDLIDRLRPGTTELVCHPGRTGGSLPARLVAEGITWADGYGWDQERAALLSERVAARLEARDVQLVSWDAL
jgi:predicted glycoside hydrolase/deacetylase ChbG (UPF0249 family)